MIFHVFCCDYTCIYGVQIFFSIGLLVLVFASVYDVWIFILPFVVVIYALKILFHAISCLFFWIYVCVNVCVFCLGLLVLVRSSVYEVRICIFPFVAVVIFELEEFFIFYFFDFFVCVAFVVCRTWEWILKRNSFFPIILQREWLFMVIYLVDWCFLCRRYFVFLALI